jgi:hypothetical protein
VGFDGQGGDGMNQAALIRKYGAGKAWERAGLFYLNPPMPQMLRGGGYEYHQYVMVQVQGDTADMYASDESGRLTGAYAKWDALTRDNGEPRGLYVVAHPSCTAALEAEGYTVVAMGEVTA